VLQVTFDAELGAGVGKVVRIAAEIDQLFWR